MTAGQKLARWEIETLMVQVDGRPMTAERRADLRGFNAPVFEVAQEGEAPRYFALKPGAQGWPVVEEITGAVAAAVPEAKRANARAEREKGLWLNGRAPKAKPKRQKGSRGLALEEADYGRHIVELLADLYRRHRISEPMLRAGNRFNAEVRAMHEPCLSAAPLVRVRVDSSAKLAGWPLGAGSWGSQEIVLGALDACGGINSGSGSILWHVVGMERSLREWHREHNHFALRHEESGGLLFGALERLAQHYGFRPRREAEEQAEGGAVPGQPKPLPAHPAESRRKRTPGKIA